MAGLHPTPLLILSQAEPCIPVDEPNANARTGDTKMSAYTFRSSRPDQWVSPRPTPDPARRLAIHGPLQPMQPRAGLIARLFGAH